MTSRRGGLLRQRKFRLFWTGESLSEVGNSVAVFAVPLVAIDTWHASTFIVTLLTRDGLAALGHHRRSGRGWVDRLTLRRIMMASDAVSVAVRAVLDAAAASWTISSEEDGIRTVTTADLIMRRRRAARRAGGRSYQGRARRWHRASGALARSLDK